MRRAFDSFRKDVEADAKVGLDMLLKIGAIDKKEYKRLLLDLKNKEKVQ